jgi:hypothetical protein
LVLNEDVPQETELLNAYPNPFNPTTTINYNLSEDGPVRLAVYDVLGREVALLVNEVRKAGAYTVTFDASHLPSGLYIYRLQTATHGLSRTVLLAK